MANWCEGELKIIGSKEKILKFLNESIEICHHIYKNDIKKPFETASRQASFTYDGYSEEINIPDVKEDEWLYVKDSKRAFIKGLYNHDSLDISYIGRGKYILRVWFYQAWDIDAHLLEQMAKKYMFEIKIYAFEKGMQFNRNIYIRRGITKVDDTIKFENYLWDSQITRIGG